MPVTGGHRLKQAIEKRKQGGVKSLEVGFFSSARYQDGTYVAAVAAYNEFGTRRIPSRPFMRNANERLKRDIPKYLDQVLVATDGVVTEQVANQVGAIAAGEIQQEIVDLKEPPNAPYTLERKGSSNPLVDTGKMRLSVTWKAK